LILKLALLLPNNICSLTKKIGIKQIPSHIREEIQSLAAQNVENEELQNFTESSVSPELKKKLKAVMEEILSQWDNV